MIKNQKVLHHLGVGAGFVGLVLWYLAAQKIGLLQLITELFPRSHEGAGFMVAIMVCMTPGFFIWTLFNRWLEKRLAVTGRFYENDFYDESDKK